ncbi:MAG TPA: serine/threonine-protein kinase [Streptosporangiaceae bacterium]|jgi:serine/threonine protein kinase|nr:serine/threonine-protein kinase [Streptosporangiaceae bacterium]
MQTDALRPGDPKRLGSYELLGRLGDGGQGTVFLGRADDGTDVAIKLLHRELTADDMARTRFLREIEFAKQVASFCTAQIIDADIEGERPYLVSEYVPGPSVLQLVLTEGPIAGGALDRLAIGTATALVAIHQAGVIHRDFKPANVLIGPGGPRVIDFGIARVFDSTNTMTSRVIGTPAFMSPEQMRGREFGKEADIFCWAATMVYAATGRPPFGNDSIPAVIQRTLHEEPDLGHIAEPLRGLIVDCLAKDPAARPTARQLLMRLLGQEDAVAGPAPAAPANEDPAAILVKIAEATARPPAGAQPGAARPEIGHDLATSHTQALPPRGSPEHGANWLDPAGPGAGAPRLTDSALSDLTDPEGFEFGAGAGAGAGPGAAGYGDEPPRRGRARAVALTTAAIVAVAATAGGTAYVLAQGSPGVRHVNNPTGDPVTVEPTSMPPPSSTSAAPTRQAPTIQPTVHRTLPRSASPSPSPSRTSARPTPTPTKTRTPTPTPTPTPPDPSSSPPGTP